jgi:hypothetical protein
MDQLKKLPIYSLLCQLRQLHQYRDNFSQIGLDGLLQAYTVLTFVRIWAAPWFSYFLLPNPAGFGSAQ